MDRITVSAAGFGWTVESDAFPLHPMLFLSGRQAERAAKGLGARLASAGRPVSVQVYLRNGALAGGFELHPCEDG